MAAFIWISHEPVRYSLSLYSEKLKFNSRNPEYDIYYKCNLIDLIKL